MDPRLEAFERLLNIMDDLRAKCPWDRKQTLETLRPLTIEETYELGDAILNNDLQEVKNELGDLMLHNVFYAKIGEEKAAFTITDPSKIFVEAFVPELDIGRVAVDAQVIVRTHAFPDLALSGRITSIAPSLDRATRSLSVRITLDAADARLRGHMFAMVELVGDGGRPIVVPADGVATLEGQDVVFVPGHEALTFVPKPVRLGRRASGFVEILAGLQEGAAVVVHGGFVLKSALSSGSISEGHEH